MSYANVAGAAVSLIGSASKGKAQRDAANADNANKRRTAKMNNMVTEGKNAAAAAEANLGRAAQAVSNQRRLRAAGENVARAGETIAKTQDAAAANSFSASVRASEELGALTADAAFRGVVGGSADTLATTLALRQESQRALAERQTGQQIGEMARSGAEFLRSGIQGLDTRAIIDQRNVSKEVAREKPVDGSLLTDLMNSKTDWRALSEGATKAGTTIKAWWQGNDPSDDERAKPGAYGI